MSTDVESRTRAALHDLAATMTPAKPLLTDLLERAVRPVEPAAVRARSRRHSRMLVATLGTAAALVIGVVVATSIDRNPSSPSPSGPPVSHQPTTTKSPTTTAPVSTSSAPPAPTTSLVADAPQQQLLRPSRSIDVATGAASVGIGYGKVWLAETATSRLVAFEPTTSSEVGSVTVRPDSAHLAFIEDAVVVCGLDGIERIDPESFTITASVTKPCASIAAGLGSVWVVDGSSPRLVRLDPFTLEQQAVIGLDAPGSVVTVAFGLAWTSGVLDATTGRVVGIEPATNAVAQRIDVPGRITALAEADSNLWATSVSELGSNVLRVDTTSGAVTTVRNSIGSEYVSLTATGSVVAIRSLSGGFTLLNAEMGTAARWYDISLAPDPFGPGVAIVFDGTTRLAWDGASLWNVIEWSDGTTQLVAFDAGWFGPSAVDGEPTVTAVVPTAHGRGRLVTAFDRIWQAGTADNSLIGVDPATASVVATFEGMPGPYIASGTDSLYVCGPGGVVRVDPTSGSTLATNGQQCFVSIAVGFGSVWIGTGSTVYRLDESTLELQATITDVFARWGIEIAFGSVWVADGEGRDANRGGHVTRIDPTTNSVLAVIPTPSRARLFEATDDAVWVTMEPIGLTEYAGLVRIDPGSNAVTATVTSFPVDATDVVSLGDDLVVSSHFGPLAIVDSTTATVLTAFDPYFDGPPGDRSAITWDGARLWTRTPSSSYLGEGALIAIDLGRYVKE